MALTQAQIDAILELDRTSQVAVGAYWKVTWDPDDPDQTRYYADIRYKQVAPFMNVGVNVEARLLDNIPDEVEFEINPDLRTEEIDITFDDIDKEIKGRFQTYGSGVIAELVYYYPDVNGWEEVWEGQLKAPKEYGWAVLKTIITNGTRSRELLLPGSTHTVGHCRFTSTFGGALPSLAAIRVNGCPYAKQFGGLGNLNPLNGLPYRDCPGDKAACHARLGTGGDDPNNPKHYGGFDSAVGAIVTDPDTGWHATTQNNASNLKDPLIVLFGVQWLTDLPKLLWRRDPNTDHPDTGWFDVVWEIGQGPFAGISNFKVNDSIIPASLVSTRLGARGQAQTAYAPDVPFFSNTGIVWTRIGQLNPDEYGPDDFRASCLAIGLAESLAFNPTSGAGTPGLLTQYFSDSNFTNALSQKVAFNVAQPQTILPPVAGLSLLQRFSLTMSGTITFEHSELTTLTLEVIGGAKVTVNGSVIINQLGSSGGTHTGNFTPVAGTPYTFLFEFKRNASSVLFPAPWKYLLKWNSASKPIETVPNSAFHLSIAASDGSNLIFSDDRVWALLTCYTNYTWGRRYNPDTKFHVDSWNHTQATLAQHVIHSFTTSDGELRTFTGRRSTFNALLKGRPTDEQIIDICRSGRITIPFWHQGKFYLKPFRPASDTELANARVFTDTGPAQNIFWRNGQPSITFSQVPDDELDNKIEMRFNDGTNFDKETPIYVDDKDQQLRAGRSLGDENLQEKNRKYSALGIRQRQEAVRLARHILWFGQFSEGGIMNNLRGVFLTSFENVLGLLRYDWIKLETEQLDGFAIGTDNGEMDLVEAPEYFQVLFMRKVGKGMVQMTVQAYNHTASLAFETVLTPPTAPGEPPTEPPGTPVPPDDPAPVPPPPLPDPIPDPGPLPDPGPTPGPGEDPEPPIVVISVPQPDEPPSALTAGYDSSLGYIEVEVAS